MTANNPRHPILIVIAIVMAMVATMTTTGAAADSTEADTTPPQTTITYPTRNQVIEAGNAFEMLGHASDNTALRKIDIAIRDRVNKTWWWGADQGFQTGWPRPHAITGQPTSGASPTDYDWAAQGDTVFLPPGTYAAYARAFDTSGNYDPTPAWVPFIVTVPDLDVVVETPTFGETVDGGLVEIEGTATGNKLERVAIAIVDRATRQWLQDDYGNFGPGFVLHDANLLDAEGTYAVGWVAWLGLPPGSYGMSVRAYDTGGNVAKTWIRFRARLFLDSWIVLGDGCDLNPEGHAKGTYEIAAVQVYIVDRATRLWLQADGTFGPRFTTHDAELQWPWDPSYLPLDTSLIANDWFFFSPDDVPAGSYGIGARAVDALGNIEPRPRPWLRCDIPSPQS